MAYKCSEHKKGDPYKHSTVTQPFVQGQLKHSRAYEARQDAYDLIDALSAYDITGVLRLSFTGYDSFIQTNNTESTENTEVELSVLFPTVQKASLPAGLKELTT